MKSQNVGRRSAMLGVLGAAAAGSRPARAADPIRIGFSSQQTGGVAVTGKAILLTCQIWAEEVNARGGLMDRPVEFVHYDDQSSPSQVPGIYTKLLDVDHVDLVMGAGTNLVAPAMPIVMEHNKVMFAMFALTVNDQFHYPRYIQTMPYGPQGKDAISRGFFEAAMTMDPKPQTVALVGADAEFAKNAVAGARAQAKRLGLKVVYDRTYPPNTVDYSPIVRAIGATSPDLIYLASYPPDSTGMVRAVREAGLKPRMFGGGMVGTQYTTIKTQLGELLNGLVTYELYAPAAASHFPGVADLLARYQARAVGAGVDELGYYVPPFCFATLQILEQSVNAVGLDQDKLAAYLHEATFKTVVGDIRFGTDGEWSTPQMLTVQFRGIQGHDKQQFTQAATEVILDPPGFKSGSLQYPFGGN